MNLNHQDLAANNLNSLFVAQSRKPAQLREIQLDRLSPFQRALLVVDSATQFIEAYAMEPIEILLVTQRTFQLPTDHELLEAAGGTDVVSRTVLLRGKASSTPFAYAESLLVQDRLPDPIRKGLETEGKGLGLLLRRNRIETHREMLWYGMEKGRELPAPIRHLEGEPIIDRTYRIIAGGRPMMQISEKFPAVEIQTQS